jgi:hypothetical protein
MKKADVPHDEAFTEGFLRADYAVDEQGKYTIVTTTGWAVQADATALALEEIDRRIAAAWEAGRAGRLSPLAYHMARRQMTTSLLAEYASVSRLRVWWHMRPHGFARMPLWLALRYCEQMQVGIGELVSLPERPESLLKD